MNTQLKDLWAKVKEYSGKMSTKTRRLIVGSLIGAILVIALVLIFSLLRPQAVLFTGLSSEEAAAIMAVLEESGVTQYRLENGDTITVPSKLENSLRAKLLLQGYPKTGFNYDVYRAGVDIMSTESDRNTAMLQDLESRMSAVIRLFDGVKDAVVTIDPEQDSRYVLDQSTKGKAQASVFVTLSGSATLSDQQASGIRNLISRSVKGLDISNIAISDSQGNLYDGGDGGTGSNGAASALKFALEEKTNRTVRSQIMQVLVPLFGEENLRVSVNSVVDVRNSVGEETTYAQPEDGEGIIGKQIYDWETTTDGNGTVGGVAGTGTNADIPNYPQTNPPTGDGNTYIRNSGTVDFNVDTKKEQIERRSGVLTDLMVSVTINSEVLGGADMEELTTHIARAAGIGPTQQVDKISIYPGPFYQADPANPGTLPNINNLPFPAWMLYAGAGGLGLLLIVLILIAVMRKKKKRRLTAEFSALLDESGGLATQDASGVDIMTIKTEKSMELRKTIRQFAEENPEIAAYMLKGWLRGEGEDVG